MAQELLKWEEISKKGDKVVTKEVTIPKRGMKRTRSRSQSKDVTLMPRRSVSPSQRSPRPANKLQKGNKQGGKSAKKKLEFNDQGCSSQSRTVDDNEASTNNNATRAISNGRNKNQAVSDPDCTEGVNQLGDGFDVHIDPNESDFGSESEYDDNTIGQSNAQQQNSASKDAAAAEKIQCDPHLRLVLNSLVEEKMAKERELMAQQFQQEQRQWVKDNERTPVSRGRGTGKSPVENNGLLKSP